MDALQGIGHIKNVITLERIISVPFQQIRGPITFAAPDIIRNEYSLSWSQVNFKSHGLPPSVGPSEISSISRSHSASAFFIASSFIDD